MSKGVVVFEFDLADEHGYGPDGQPFFMLAAPLVDAVRDMDTGRPRMTYLGIKDVADNVLAVFEKDQQKEREMSLRKYSEGNVIPENEQQKTAQANPGLTPEAAQEILDEGDETKGLDPESRHR